MVESDPYKTVETSDSTEDSQDTDKTKRRQAAARRLSFARPSNEDAKPKQESSSIFDTGKNQEKAEPLPTSLAEIFEGKAKQIDDHEAPAEEQNEDAEVKEDVDLAANTLVEARQNEVAGEQTEEAADVNDFLEDLQAQPSIDSETINEAADQKLAELGAEPADVERLEEEYPSIPPEAEYDKDTEEDLPIDEQEFENIPEDIEDEAEEDPVAPTTPSSCGAGGGGRTGAGAPSGPSGFGGPIPPHGGGPSRPYYGGNVPLVSSSNNQNTLYPTPIESGNINMPPSPYMPDRANPVVMALLGYVIGRRRGRKRAERRAGKEMRTYERKVKKQIEDIDWQMRAKEQQIRKLSREKSEQTKQVASRNIKAEQPRQEHAATPIFERQPAIEASQLHGASSAREHIAQVLFSAAEIPLAVSAERAAKITKPEAARVEQSREIKDSPPRITEKQVETLNRQELLGIAEKIVIDGTSLRQVYESRLVGEQGLRRLVAEHLRGGDIKKVLRREIVEHEIDFERDPAVRDAASSGDGLVTSATTSIGGQAAIDRLIQKASANFSDDSPEAAYYRHLAAQDAKHHAENNNHQRIIDIGIGGVITVLAAAVVILLLTRG